MNREQSFCCGEKSLNCVLQIQTTSSSHRAQFINTRWEPHHVLRCKLTKCCPVHIKVFFCDMKSGKETNLIYIVITVTNTFFKILLSDNIFTAKPSTLFT